MKRHNICLGLIMFLFLFPLVLSGQDHPRDKASKETSNTRIVPFRDGYCSVDGPNLIMGKAGAVFSFGPTIKYKGEEFQVMIPKTENAYAVGTIDVQLLTKKKEPSGNLRKLECTDQKWNQSLKTVDLTYTDNPIIVIIHIYTPATGGFVIKEVECTAQKGKK